jgi:hypothetical protein
MEGGSTMFGTVLSYVAMRLLGRVLHSSTFQLNLNCF